MFSKHQAEEVSLCLKSHRLFDPPEPLNFIPYILVTFSISPRIKPGPNRIEIMPNVALV